MKIAELLAYSENCRSLMKETLAANPDVWERPFRTDGRFRTVRALLSHIIGAEERWIQNRIPGLPAGSYEDRAAESLETMFADWEAVRAVTRAFIEAQDEAGLARVIPVSIGERWSGNLSIEQILFHIFNHESHHRGQMTLALMLMGIDPPDFDFVLLMDRPSI